MFEMSQDIFDSRDLIERLEELETLKDSASEGEASPEEVAEWEDSEEEYNTLHNFADGAELNCPDWEFGETFIHEDYFTEYAIELTTELGYLPENLPGFIESNIDWEGVANDLKFDYTEYELDGNTYYAR